MANATHVVATGTGCLVAGQSPADLPKRGRQVRVVRTLPRSCRRWISEGAATTTRPIRAASGRALVQTSGADNHAADGARV